MLLLLLLPHTKWRGVRLLLLLLFCTRCQDGRLLLRLLLQDARWMLQLLLLLGRCAAAQAASRMGCSCLRHVDVSW